MIKRSNTNGPMQFHKGTEQELLSYVLEHATTNNPQSVIDTIDSFCWNNHWMMHIGDEKGTILSNEVVAAKPMNVLELGTYCGYSAVRIAMNLPFPGKLYTIDPNKSLVDSVTKQIVDKAGLSGKVVFLSGYSGEVIKSLVGSVKFDLVFLDHDKKQYFPDLLLLESNDMLSSGCTLVADNVIVFNISDYYDYVKDTKKFTTKVYNTNLEYDEGDYKDGIVVSKMC